MCPHWSTLLTCIIFCSSQLQFGKSFQNKVFFSTFYILTILNKDVHLCYSAQSFSTNKLSLFINLPEVFSSRTKYINSLWSFWEMALLYIGRSLKVWFCFFYLKITPATFPFSFFFSWPPPWVVVFWWLMSLGDVCFCLGWIGVWCSKGQTKTISKHTPSLELCMLRNT